MHLALTPCHRSLNKAFITGEDAPGHSIRAAIAMCEQCPMRRGCARDGLTAGSSLDGSVIAPARGVIQAGVVCRGDDATARALAAIAGVRPPALREKKRRNMAPEECRHCGHPMVSWTRGEVPAGKVMHRGRGYCVGCRAAYAADLKARGRLREGLHKPIDRKRHHELGVKSG